MINISIPIMGNVLANVSFLREINPSHFLPTSVLNFDVSPYLLPAISSNKQNPKFNILSLYNQFFIMNTFSQPIVFEGVRTLNTHFHFNSSIQLSKNTVIQPLETIKVGDIFLNMTSLNFSNGYDYLYFILNHTIVPLSVSVNDKSLLCQWEGSELVKNC